MSAVEIRLGVEDLPGELILRQLLRGNRRLHIGAVLGHQGEGYLKSQLGIWNRAASALPIIVLFDLDRGCAPTKCAGLLSEVHPNLLLRIAVFEVESWLLADADAMHAWAGIPVAKLPIDADVLPDPKQALINLVRRHSPARLRKQMVPDSLDRRTMAPGYNDVVRELIERHWNPDRAQPRSRSLMIARQRISTWRPQVQSWRRPTEG